MAQLKKTFTKDPGDSDKTLDEVLQDIEDCNADGAKLVAYSIQPGDVMLIYEKQNSR